MKVLDTLLVGDGSEAKRIDLCLADLTALPDEHAVDVLVVSAFPDDYTPTPASLIGALDATGISVNELADHKAVDLRETCSCWLSEPVPRGHGFERILCFEPEYRGQPPEVVGDIFRSLMPFLEGAEAVRTVAMPLVATGDVGEPIANMLPPLLDAAVEWMAHGVALDRLLVAVHDGTSIDEAQQLFAQARSRQSSGVRASSDPAYDVFLSYAREDSEQVDVVERELLGGRHGIRVFRDRQDIKPGAAWQQEIYEALDDCRVVLAVYSPDYLASKVCQEEINIAIFRTREQGDSVLFPVYLKSADPLPSYLALRNYVDCRDGGPERIASACAELVQRL